MITKKQNTFNWTKSNYVFGEVFLKTKKNLYMIQVLNLCGQVKGCFYDVYKNVDSYNHNDKRLTNSFTHCDGNEHITNLKDKRLFCNIKDNSLLKSAVLKRLMPIKIY